MSSPNYNQNEEMNPEDKQQEKVLSELTMILTTVKQIDLNLIKSIQLLEENVNIDKGQSDQRRQTRKKTRENASVGGIRPISFSEESLTYREMVVRNVQVLSDVLKMLDAIDPKH